jgi:hypothetical protein
MAEQQTQKLHEEAANSKLQETWQDIEVTWQDIPESTHHDLEATQRELVPAGCSGGPDEKRWRECRD